MDRHMDGRTKPFVELLFATKNIDEKKILMKKQGHRHKSPALVKQNVKNVKTLKNSQRLSKTLRNSRKLLKTLENSQTLKNAQSLKNSKKL